MICSLASSIMDFDFVLLSQSDLTRFSRLQERLDYLKLTKNLCDKMQDVGGEMNDERTAHL